MNQNVAAAYSASALSRPSFVTRRKKQLRSPVFWADNVRTMADEGVDTFVEVGPGHVLARMVKRISDHLTAVSLDDAEVAPIPISVLPPEPAR